MSRQRRNFTPKFKLKVALEALQEKLTLSQIAQKYEIHANLVSTWKQALLENGEAIFEARRGPQPQQDNELLDRLYKQIGQLTVENEWFKKKLKE